MSRISKLRRLMKYRFLPLASNPRILAAAMGAILGLALVEAGAQEYSADRPEEVVVTPPLGYQRSPAGLLPVIIVSQSKAVRYDDLDLRTDDGADTFRSRVYAAARSVCSRLTTAYPATYVGWTARGPHDRDCYRDAITRALPGADAAINAARVGYGGH